MASLLEKEIAARAGVKPEATVSELRGEAQASSTQATDTDQNINQESGVEAKGTPSPIALDNALPKDLNKNVQGVSKTEAEVAAEAAAATAATAATQETAKKAEADAQAAQTAALLQKMESMFGTLQASIGEQIGAVTVQVNTLNDSVESIKKSQDILHDRVVETEKIAKSADSTIRGKLITSDMSNDGTTSSVRKAATVTEEGYGGTIDTAFQQSIRKAAQPIQRGRAGR
jgi:hypothetical protein